MLYINGERLNTKSKDKDYEHHDLVLDYHKTIREAKEYYGQYLVLETRQRPHPDAKTGYPIYPGTKGLLLRTTIITDDNISEWIYSQNTLGKKDGTDDLKLEVPNLLIEKGQYPIEIERNPDLIYYVLKCGKVGRTESENKKFHIRDDAERSKVNVSQRRLESKVGYMIYTAISDPNLKTLAKSFGIHDVDSKHIDVVREELYNKVERDEKAKKTGSTDRRGYEEFLESADVRVNDKVAALCVDAEEKGFLVYDVEQRSWMLNYKDGNMPYRLKELSGGEFGDPIGSLVSYLLSSPDALRKVENVLNRQNIKIIPEDEIKETVTIEQVQKEGNVQRLKKWIKTLEPSIKTPNTMKADDAKEILYQLLAAAAVG